MKKALVFVLAIFFLVGTFQTSFAKKEKTGKVKDNVFTDSKFEYHLEFLKNWKLKTENEPSLVRATLMKKNYQVDKSRRFSGHETNVPTIIIMADTTSLSLEEFKDEFLKEKPQIKNIDKYRMKFEFLTNSELLQEREILVDSIPAHILTFRKPYLITVANPTDKGSYRDEVRSDYDDPGVRNPEDSEKLVEDFIAGHLLFFKKGNEIYVIHFSCERQFIVENHREFTTIMDKWKFKE